MKIRKELTPAGSDQAVRRVSEARLPTAHGVFTAVAYRALADGVEHMALVMGDVGDGRDVLARVHSECLTGDIFGSRRCDCGEQLDEALRRIAREGRGVLVYLRGHEGRGIGLGHKLRAYALQEAGRDTVEANVELGFAVDARDYSVGAHILRNLGAVRLRLMTNNPDKHHALAVHGLEIVAREPLISTPTPENRRYLETKRDRLGHLLDAAADPSPPVHALRTSA
jgi:3,4-dihydroxy 2-butanone 4-phosphate synthase/GTP cyclohydrolase II